MLSELTKKPAKSMNGMIRTGVKVTASCLSEKERARQLDTILGFGNYQWFQVWVLQTLIAIIGAINYYHVVFLVSDPSQLIVYQF